MRVSAKACQNCIRWSRRNMILRLRMSCQEVRMRSYSSSLILAQKALRELKGKISAQSKKNFVLERDVRYLDSRIALLIQNRMALDEQNEFAARIEDAMDTNVGQFPDDRRVQVSIYHNAIDRSNTEISFTYYRRNRDILRLYVVWSRCRK